MLRRLVVAINCIIMVALGVPIAPVAHADHIEGHDDRDPTFPVPLPGRDFFDGGAVMLRMIGPREGTVITSTAFDITFISDGATPARDLFIEIRVQLDNDVREFSITGADLGFGEGPGKFSGRITTHALDGEVWQYDSWPHSLIDLEIGAINGGIKGSGYFVDSFITFDVTGRKAPLSSFNLRTGTLLRGGLDDLQSSDDTYFHTLSGYGTSRDDLHSTEFAVLAVSDIESPIVMDITIESRVSHPGAVAEVWVKNFQTRTYERIQIIQVDVEDAAATIQGLDAATYVNRNNSRVRLRIKIITLVPFLAFNFESWIDQVEVRVR